eukprot:Lithocolla_globosa_v1_NODE_2335_length_2044_cov_8.581699.p3 type:complete len:210 gc:universal NODE_2335_length_2044_cov_8.581699:762-133(-)
MLLKLGNLTKRQNVIYVNLRAQLKYVTGKYLGAACNSCNLKARTPQYVPISFHNGKGYDFHFIIKALNETDGALDCIPNNEEKYSTVKVGKMRFIDSYALLSSGLDNLAGGMKREDFKYTSQFKWQGSELSKEQLDLLLRKIPYPYEYINSEERRNEVVPIKQEHFYDNLNDKAMTDEQYSTYLEICKRLNIKTIENIKTFTFLLMFCF